VAKQKMSFASKLYFGLFIFLAVLTAFLFWAVSTAKKEGGVDMATTLTGAIIACALTIFFGVMCFIRFLRSRTVAGGLFLTTAVSTAVFLGTSRFLGMIIGPIMAFGGEPEAGAGGMGFVIMLAQIGLFALWFAFLMITIKIQVSPIRKVNSYLDKLMDDEKLRRVRIGKSKQYRELEQKLKELSRKMKGEEKINEGRCKEDKNS